MSSRGCNCNTSSKSSCSIVHYGHGSSTSMELSNQKASLCLWFKSKIHKVSSCIVHCLVGGFEGTSRGRIGFQMLRKFA